MSSTLEQLKPKTLDTVPSLAEAKEMFMSVKKLTEKMTLLDNSLRTIENKLQSDPTLRKDEKAELEQVFNEIEAQKKMISAQMNTPAARVEVIDDKLRELEAKMESSEFRKDEKDAFNEEFNTLETKKRLLINTPEEQPEPTVPITRNLDVQTAPEPERVIPQSVVTNEPALVISQEPSGPVAPDQIVPDQVEAVPVVAPITPEEPQVPQEPQKTPAELLAQKIRNTEKLSDEDYEFRSKHWGEVEIALLKLAQPEPIIAENVIEYTGPDLERSRNDYVEVLFKNKDSYYPDKATFAHIKSLKEKYHANIDAEVANIKPVGDRTEDKIECKKLRLAFLKKERDAYQRELLRLEGEEMKKRVGKALSNAANETAKFLAAAKNKLSQGFDATKRFLSDEGKGPGMGWIYYLIMAAAVPMSIGAHYAKKPGDKIEEGMEILRKKFRQFTAPYDPSKAPEVKKKTLAEKFGSKGEKKQESPVPSEGKTEAELAIEKKKQDTEKRKKDFLERATGVELKGRDLDAWIKLGAVSTGKFFNPSRFKTSKTIDDYPPFQRKIHDALLVQYKKDLADKTKDIKSINKLSLQEYVTQLADKDKLKDLWNPTSNNNS